MRIKYAVYIQSSFRYPKSWSNISIEYCISLYPNRVPDDEQCPTICNIVIECTALPIIILHIITDTLNKFVQLTNLPQ